MKNETRFSEYIHQSREGFMRLIWTEIDFGSDELGFNVIRFQNSTAYCVGEEIKCFTKYIQEKDFTLLEIKTKVTSNYMHATVLIFHFSCTKIRSGIFTKELSIHFSLQVFPLTEVESLPNCLSLQVYQNLKWNLLTKCHISSSAIFTSYEAIQS
jgi:hypothetical protein